MKRSILILAVSCLLFSNCKKETGPTGPQGPAGPSGTNGAANIQNFSFTTNSNNWQFDNANNAWIYSYSCSAVNTQVLSSGAVMVFLGDGTGNTWIAMPVSQQGVEFNYALKSAIVEINFTLTSGSIPPNPGGQAFRVVVIPPGKVVPGITNQTFDQLKETYNLN